MKLHIPLQLFESDLYFSTAPSGKDVAVRYKKEGPGVQRIEYTPTEAGMDDSFLKLWLGSDVWFANWKL